MGIVLAMQPAEHIVITEGLLPNGEDLPMLEHVVIVRERDEQKKPRPRPANDNAD